MIAVGAGAAAALAFGVSTLCSARATRLIGPASTLGWVAITGLLLTLPLVALSGLPATLDATAAGWLALSGAGNTLLSREGGYPFESGRRPGRAAEP